MTPTANPNVPARKSIVSSGEFKKVYDPSIPEGSPWYINDHTFIRAQDGTWHLFGITHPEPANPQDEKFLAHATAPSLFAPWTKHPHVMHADESVGETHVWAPHVIRHDDRYWMFYCGGGKGDDSYRLQLATSTDLFNWERHPGNPLVIDGYHARDPMVLRVGDQWVMYYTANSTPQGGNHTVAAVVSKDLVHWSDKKEVFVHTKTGTYGGPTESPFVVERKGKYYLFICSNAPYDHTVVYESESPFHWDINNPVGEFPSHAAEVIRTPENDFYISRCGWGKGGVYLASLNWAD